MPYIGTSPSQGVRRVHTYTATANQTSFSGAGAEGATLSYKDSNFVDVYQNGVKLGDADYTATSGTAIVLGTGATVSDLVVIVAYDVFSAADTVSKADGGQFDGAVTFAGGVSGVLDADGGITVDNITIDGTEIDLSSGDLTIDVAGNILLNADGGGVYFQDASTLVGSIQNSSSDLVITSEVQDKDIIFKGDDGGASVTALTLDMSDAGTAIFNHDAKITSGNIQFGASGSETGQIEINSSRLLLRSTGDASGLRFDGSSYTPFKNGSQANGTVDIGSTGARFKDLYLSSGVFLGGTGSANELDDYEFGTFSCSTSQSGYAIQAQHGRYTKIGQLVHINFKVNFNAVGSNNSTITIAGLPITVGSIQSSGVVRESSNTGAIYVVNVSPSGTEFSINSMDNVSNGSTRTFATNENYIGSFTYHA